MTERERASWFDAHLDLAYLAETGRDMHAPVTECRGRHLPASVTIPSLVDGRVMNALATIFTQPAREGDPDASGPWCYTQGDTLAAWKAGTRQLKLYHAWRDAGIVELMPARGKAGSSAESSSGSSGGSVDGSSDAPGRLGILMENADPIESPEQVAEWRDAGVVAVGLTWAVSSRYAAGNAVEPTEDGGVTSEGRALIEALDDAGVVHDLSHLSPRATVDLLEHTDAPVIASHSNCRALMTAQPAKAAQRHLDDQTIREIARRDGVVGINLYSPFLDPGIGHADAVRATIDNVVAHIEHVCEMAGDRAHVGLGSDADGGFAGDRLPSAIDTPRDYDRIAEALRNAGWNDDDVRAFARGNWDRFWSGG